MQVHIAALSRRLAHSRQHPARRRVLRVLAVQQVGVHLGFGGLLLVLLELSHHLLELVRLEGRDLAFIGGLETHRPRQRLGNGGFQRGVGRRRVEVAQVPPKRLRTRLLQSLDHGGSG